MPPEASSPADVVAEGVVVEVDIGVEPSSLHATAATVSPAARVVTTILRTGRR